MKPRSNLLAVVLAGGIYSGSLVQSQTRYSVDLLPPLGEPGGRATAISDASQAVGKSFTEFVPCGPGLLCSYAHAVLWNDGTVVELHDPAFANVSGALGMNNTGLVVGQALFGGYQAWVWDGKTMAILPSIGGEDTLAMDVNDAGQIVGWSDNAGDVHQAVLWQDGEIIELGTYPDGTESVAEGINEQGAIVGGAKTDGDLTFTERTTLWENGMMIMVDTRDVKVPQSKAYAINANRQVVGEAWDVTIGADRARLWEEDESTGEWRMTSIGSVTEGTRSVAYDINDNGQIVGEAGWSEWAFIWEAGELTRLNELIPADSGWILRSARAINNAGQIVGFGNAPDGPTRAFILTPIPGTDCPADIDGDGDVGINDLLDLLAAWGSNPGHPADLDGDGMVGITDFLMLLANWGPCGG